MEKQSQSHLSDAYLAEQMLQLSAADAPSPVQIPHNPSVSPPLSSFHRKWGNLPLPTPSRTRQLSLSHPLGSHPGGASGTPSPVP